MHSSSFRRNNNLAHQMTTRISFVLGEGVASRCMFGVENKMGEFVPLSIYCSNSRRVHVDPGVSLPSIKAAASVRVVVIVIRIRGLVALPENSHVRGGK
jgi:hypothetical protein